MIGWLGYICVVDRRCNALMFYSIRYGWGCGDLVVAVV